MKQLFMFLLLAGITLEGCNTKAHEMAIKDAHLVTVCLLEDIKAEQYDKIRRYYSEDFFANVTEEQWISDLKKIKEHSGDIRSYLLLETNANNENEIQTVIFKYKVDREFSPTEETFTALCLEGSTRITGHHVKVL